MTPEELEAVRVLSIAWHLVDDAVREAGNEGIPSGPLFAVLGSQGMSYAVYQQLLLAMCRRDVVHVTGDVVYTGPCARG